jgi:PIN domain-containing protein
VLLTLADGANGDTVLERLFERKTVIGNFHGDPDGYFTWAMETAEQLRNQLRRSDIDRLVFTPQLWRIQEAVSLGDIPRSRMLLRAEIVDRQAVFDQAYHALRAEIRRWKAPNTVIAAVDTSVFLHHEHKIRDIDWPQLVDAGAAAVRLVLPRLVIDELDKGKESGTSQLRWRAGHTLGVLDELLDDPLGRAVLRERDADFFDSTASGRIGRDAVTLEVLYDDPYHVRLADPDDEIIDRAVALQGYAGRKVRLVTMDTSMRLRARMRDLRVHKPPRDIGDEPAKPEPKPRRIA